jgi:hypothetical protein
MGGNKGAGTRQFQAINETTPPAALIFSLLTQISSLSGIRSVEDTYSAFWETNRAFTMKGRFGSLEGKLVYYGMSEKRSRHAHSIAQYLSVPMAQGVDDGDDLRIRGQTLPLLLRHERPQLVDVDCWAPLGVALQVKVAHADFTKVTGVVLVKVGSAAHRVKVRGLV